MGTESYRVLVAKGHMEHILLTGPEAFGIVMTLRAQKTGAYGQ